MYVERDIVGETERTKLGRDANMIKYKCPNCRELLENKPTMEGKHDSCPRCGALHVVPIGSISRPSKPPTKNKQNSKKKTLPPQSEKEKKICWILGSIFLLGGVGSIQHADRYGYYIAVLIGIAYTISACFLLPPIQQKFSFSKGAWITGVIVSLAVGGGLMQWGENEYSRECFRKNKSQIIVGIQQDIEKNNFASALKRIESYSMVSDDELQRLREKARAGVEKVKQFNEHFSDWDGSHRPTVRFLKGNLNDAGSFEHVDTTFKVDFPSPSQALIVMKYRARNGFGAMILSKLSVIVNMKSGEVLKVVSRR
jgi:hypothetical protein